MLGDSWYNCITVYQSRLETLRSAVSMISKLYWTEFSHRCQMSQISVGLNTLQELVISSLENLQIQSLTKSVELNSGRTEMQEHKGVVNTSPSLYQNLF